MDNSPTQGPLQTDTSSVSPGNDQSLVTSSGKKPLNIAKKIVIIGLAFILIIIFSEAIYLVINRFNRRGSSPNGTAEFTPTSDVTQPVYYSQQTKKDINFNSVDIFFGTLDTIKEKSEFLENATISYTISGVVSETSYEAESNTIKVVLKSSFDNFLTYSFTQEDIENSEVSIFNQGQTLNSTIRELKPGDFVTMFGVINILDTSSLYKLKFSVIRE